MASSRWLNRDLRTLERGLVPLDGVAMNGRGQSVSTPQRVTISLDHRHLMRLLRNRDLCLDQISPADAESRQCLQRLLLQLISHRQR